jgi:AraC-like DNA-binding protein
MIVKEEIKKLGLHCTSVDLGQVETSEDISAEQLNQIKIALSGYGLELMDNKKSTLIERIKNVIIEMVHYEEELPKINFSDYLTEKLHYNYTYLANLFSETEGITIEHFIIKHKIEKVKELIIYNELNISEIADKLHYSSVAHLSNQFKKVTGLTPSFFKSLKNKKRQRLEDL